MPSSNPQDWEFCILPRSDWEGGRPTAFINPISARGEWDDSHTLGSEFKKRLRAIHAVEVMECHIAILRDGDIEVLRTFFLSEGMKESEDLYDLYDG